MQTANEVFSFNVLYNFIVPVRNLFYYYCISYVRIAIELMYVFYKFTETYSCKVYTVQAPTKKGFLKIHLNSKEMKKTNNTHTEIQPVKLNHKIKY